jgi:threonine dehydrogenase-like Zn-dependent dehydrogenase
MKATVLHAPGDIRLDDVPDPSLQAPTDALVRVTAACVCGSDLWPYRGINEVQGPTRIGHEFVGIVEEVGSQVRSVRPGAFVVAPFMYSDNTCPHCRVGIQSRCATGGFWGGADRDGRFVDGGQGEYVRVPLADGTLVATREVPDDALVPSLLSLSDVMGTGWHAAVAAGVREGDTVVVVGDGAVGLCGVLAAARMGAERVVALSRHAPRQAVARRFGATDVVEVRGDEAVESVHELTEGVGADAVLECVGTNEAMQTAIASARPGATVGYVGVPHGVEYPVRDRFARNVGIAGGIAPARQYLPRLRDEVLAGEIEPGLVFDLELPLTEVAEAYAAMDERRAIKSLVRP